MTCSQNLSEKGGLEGLRPSKPPAWRASAYAPSGSPVLTGKNKQEAILEVGVRMRIARYAAQELKADFLKQASRSQVALEHFSLNLSQAECAESIACDQPRGGGADTLAPEGTADDDSKFRNALRFGSDSQPNCPHACGRSLRYDRPPNTGVLAKSLAMALKPVSARFD